MMPSDEGRATSRTEGASASLMGVSGSSAGNMAEAHTTVPKRTKINIQRACFTADHPKCCYGNSGEPLLSIAPRHSISAS
jgi:hypothetical protein